MFDFFNPHKQGKIYDPKAPKKKGIALFFEVLFREFWALLGLNLIFFLACLPVVTVGAAYGALYTVLIRMLRDKPGDIWPDFWKAFCENAKGGSLWYFLCLLLWAVLSYAHHFYQEHLPLLSYGVLWAAIVFGLAVQYLFPLLVSVHLPIKALAKNSLLLSMAGLKQSIASLALYALFLLGSLLFFPYSILWILAFGLVLPPFLNCFITYGVIETYVISQGEAPAQKEAGS